MTEDAKKCSKCKEVKDRSEFGIAKKYKDGLTYKCRLCIRAYNLAYAIANKEKLDRQGKEYRAINKDDLAKKKKVYYEANKDRLDEYHRGWRLRNPERILENSKRWYSENKEAIAERDRLRREAQPSGIYRVTCTKSDRFYIGATKSFHSRTRKHKSRLMNGTHRNSNLQAEYNLHGPESFTYELVEECPDPELSMTEMKHLEEHMSNPLCCNILKVSSGHHT